MKLWYRTRSRSMFKHPMLPQMVHPVSAIETAKAAMNDAMVVITGPTGVGKSILAEAMTDTDERTRWFGVTTADLFPSTPDDVRASRQKLVSAPILVLDDLDAPPPRLADDAGPAAPDVEDATLQSISFVSGRPFIDYLESVIHGRAAAERRTIVTTPLTESQVEAKYSIAISRFVFGGTRIELDPSYDWTKHPRIEFEEERRDEFLF